MYLEHEKYVYERFERSLLCIFTYVMDIDGKQQRPIFQIAARNVDIRLLPVPVLWIALAKHNQVSDTAMYLDTSPGLQKGRVLIFRLECRY